MTADSTQRNCLVTGGGGFIGSHLVERLVSRGDRVVVIDDFSTGRRSNLAAIDETRLRVVTATVSTGLREFEPGTFDEIHHLAAAVGVRLVIDEPIHTIETNILETSAILEFAADTSTPLLLASTSEVYGKSTKALFAEDDDLVFGPTIYHRWSYACSKAIDEYLGLAHHREHGLPIAIVRLFNTVGPRQVGRYGMVLPRFVAAALEGRPLEVYGDGRQTRCFCDVRDVAEALSGILSEPACIGTVLNLGNDEPIDIRGLAELVVSTLGSASPIVLVPYGEAFGAGFDDLRDRRPDLSRIRKATGFRPRIPLEQTIRDLARDRRIGLLRGRAPTIMTPPPEPYSLELFRNEAESITLETIGGVPDSFAASAVDLLNSYAHIFIVAFLVTLLATPLVRRAAIAMGVIDHPDEQRKSHGYPVAYLGGVAVFLGLIAAVVMSYLTSDDITVGYLSVPIAVVIGMVAITFTGLADDLWGWDPRLKVAGQLVAAAALAVEEVGVKVAAGVLAPVARFVDPILGCEGLVFSFTTPIGIVSFDTVYWVGTAIIAIFVLGGCNSANLIDGLDGLLSGIVAIIAVGLLAICLLMASAEDTLLPGLAGARVVLCLALLGAVLGFLPHNFNPASIFLGDCGSLLLGYMCVVIILMLGDMGQTHLVFAGLIIFSLPIMDTTLAIIRRRLAGIPMSAADDQHIHHQLKRALGGVRRAVIALYGIGALFAIVGVALAALVLENVVRLRFIYAIALVLFGFIGVIAVKAARRQQILLSVTRATKSKPAAAPAGTSTPKATPEGKAAPAASKPRTS